MIEKKELIFKNIYLLCFLGITAVSIFNSALFYSLKTTQVITGVLMISTVPVMIILFSIILKIEKTNTFQVLGVIFSLLGVLFIISKADFEVFKNLAFEKGDLFALFAMISWSLYSALLKKGVALIGANRAGIYLHLMPILAAILAMIIFDEVLLFYHYIGGIFIISGILLSNKKNA